MKCKRVMVIAGLDQSLLNFRGPLLRSMVLAGHEVVAMAPAETAGVAERLAADGVRFVPVPAMERTGTNLWREWRTRRELTGLIRREQPDIVLAYTIKPVIHGLPAAEAAGVAHRFALITGLGTAFYSGGWRGALLNAAATHLYRRALRTAAGIFVQNGETRDIFLFKKIIDGRAKTILVRGSGVDMDHFQMTASASPMTFLMLSRLLRDKGVAEFVEAARLCKGALPRARFLVVGPRDPNPAAVAPEKLAAWQAEGVVEFRDAVMDVRPLLSECTIYVLPSYHEGMPRSVIEAMATGRPIITTDTIGCRETVIAAGAVDADGLRWGENGVLVPVKNARALAAAMLKLGENPALGVAMGRRGRAIAEDQFDVRRINRVMLEAMGLHGLPSTLS